MNYTDKRGQGREAFTGRPVESTVIREEYCEEVGNDARTSKNHHPFQHQNLKKPGIQVLNCSIAAKISGSKF